MPSSSIIGNEKKTKIQKKQKTTAYKKKYKKYNHHGRQCTSEAVHPPCIQPSTDCVSHPLGKAIFAYYLRHYVCLKQNTMAPKLTELNWDATGHLLLCVCGTVLGDWSFCVACGAKLPTPERPGEEQQEVRSSPCVSSP